MRNTIGDLNNYLFETLERLNDDELKGEELETEIKKSRAITDVSAQIIKNASLALKAKELQLEYGEEKPLVPMLQQGKENGN